MRHFAYKWMCSLALLSCISNAYAVKGPCGSLGSLHFFGKTSNNSQSVWISLAGKHGLIQPTRLRAGDSLSLIDEFAVPANQFKISLSSIVGNGSAYRHGLYDESGGDGGGGCLIEELEQTGGVLIPIPTATPLPTATVAPTATPAPSATPQPTPAPVRPPINEVIPSPDQMLNNTRPANVLAVLLRQHDISHRITDGLTLRQSPTEPDQRWHGWAEFQYLALDDQRYGRNGDTSLSLGQVGMDKQLSPSIVIGWMLSSDRIIADTFGGQQQADSNAWGTGPYLGYRLNEQWLFDGWLGYEQRKVDSVLLDVLRGQQREATWFVASNLTGVFPVWQDATLQPKASLYYGRTQRDSYDAVLKLPSYAPAVINIEQDRWSTGIAGLSLELQQAYTLTNQWTARPFIQLGANYVFADADDGRVLGDNLRMNHTDPWYFRGRVGVKAQHTDKSLIDLSLMQLHGDHLDAWALHFSASLLFH